MECIPPNKVLKFRPDTLKEVRKDLNLDKPGRIEEAIDILEDWVQKQPHFVKKDFSRDYLERTLMTAKGLVERAKDRIDKLCTFRTLLPDLFKVDNPLKEFERLRENIVTAHIPQLTPKQYRTYVCQLKPGELNSSRIVLFYKYMIMLCEYFKQNDYSSGFIVVLDYTSINIMNFVTKVNPMELRQIITVMTEGYGLRIKGVHVISSSKMVDTLLQLLKQVFSAKLSNRIHSHKSVDSLYDHVPKEILPLDYGGKEKTLLELNQDWLEAITSKEFQEYLKEMNKAKTNESCRQADKFNENYIGMPGSFRALSVD